MSHEFEADTRVRYDLGDGEVAQFVPRCPACFRFVKADKIIYTSYAAIARCEPNATCSKHGRVAMPFEGFV